MKHKEYSDPKYGSALYEETFAAIAILHMLDFKIESNDGRLSADSSAYLDFYLDTKENVRKLFSIKEK